MKKIPRSGSERNLVLFLWNPYINKSGSAKVPLKIKFFMWLIQHNAILTKDNLLKRKWQGDKRCCFHSGDENINNLFFDCSLAKYVWSLVAMVLGADCRPSSHDQFWVWVTSTIPRFQHFHMVGLLAICWALWNARNRVCFKGKMTRSPTEIICSASSFLTYWAGLQKNRRQGESGSRSWSFKGSGASLSSYGGHSWRYGDGVDPVATKTDIICWKIAMNLSIASNCSSVGFLIFSVFWILVSISLWWSLG